MRDEAGYTEFVVARWNALYRLAYLLTGSCSAAEELLQTALLRTYVSWPRVRKLDAADAYVRKVLLSALVFERRREWDREPPPGEAPESSEDAMGSATLNHELLWPLVCSLPAPQRAVVVLRYYEEANEEEIATLLGRGGRAVDSHASEATGALRRGLAVLDTRQPRRLREP